jgi:hypothetical protein
MSQWHRQDFARGSWSISKIFLWWIFRENFIFKVFSQKGKRGSGVVCMSAPPPPPTMPKHRPVNPTMVSLRLPNPKETADFPVYFNASEFFHVTCGQLQCKPTISFFLPYLSIFWRTFLARFYHLTGMELPTSQIILLLFGWDVFSLAIFLLIENTLENSDGLADDAKSSSITELKSTLYSMLSFQGWWCQSRQCTQSHL